MTMFNSYVKLPESNSSSPNLSCGCDYHSTDQFDRDLLRYFIRISQIRSDQSMWFWAMATWRIPTLRIHPSGLWLLRSQGLNVTPRYYQPNEGSKGLTYNKVPPGAYGVCPRPWNNWDLTKGGLFLGCCFFWMFWAFFWISVSLLSFFASLLFAFLLLFLSLLLCFFAFLLLCFSASPLFCFSAVFLFWASQA